MPHPAVLTTEDLAGLVEELKQEWRAGTAQPDAAGVFRDFPALARHRSLFVDLAYEDYCLQEEAGAPPDVESFCRNLPVFRTQVREVLRGHRDIADHPEHFTAGDVQWPEPGDTVERLHLRRELGRGAFARVYLAHDPDANRLVALKLAPAPSGESRQLGPLKHPHIGGMHWARPTTGNLHALCMPFVGSATLADVSEAVFHQGRPATARTILEAAANDEALPPVVTARMSYARAVAAIGARLADALAHLHKAGVTHGDLKPSNVLLGSGGHPYLIDFNLAIGPESSRLRCGGTLPYMAPERVRLLIDPTAGEADSTQADIYSFGALLFELLTGRLPVEPVESLDQDAVAADLLRRTPPPVRTCGRGIPSALARLVDQCLSADPARRPTAGELSRRLARLSRRRYSLFVAVVAVLVGVGLGAALRAGAADRPTPATAVQAEQPAPVRAEPTTPREHFARGVERLAANDLAAAAHHFLVASEDGRDPRAKAYQAYSYTRNGQHPFAIDLYQSALDDRYDRPWVHNNLAYSLLSQGKVRAQLERAVTHAKTASERLSDPQPALYNLARAHYLIDLNRDENRLDKRRCLDDLKKALPNGPVTADQLVMEALMLTAAGDEQGPARAVIFSDLEKAVGLGYSRWTIAHLPVFAAHLKGLQEFAPFAAQPAPRPGEKDNSPPAFGLLAPVE